MPFSPGGIIPRDMDARQWDRLTRGIQADTQTRTFQPVWAGFSADPTGLVTYYDFGILVAIWFDSGFLGTSNANQMRFTGLPEAIIPRGPRYEACLVIDDGNDCQGGIIVNGAGSDEVDFLIGVVSGTNLVPLTTGFTTSGNKGLTAGFKMIYPK